ncbi:MAG TPA: response regulator, partial [bacterium]|nr:response regulator [bacterium]
MMTTREPRARILWADDEMELLQSHLLFLKEKGYVVNGVTNGDDAVGEVASGNYDLVLLDEMMPGKDGLTTLMEIKETDPGLPVIMITKNKEESLMEEAIGAKIADYLTKPVNPSQILLACKKILERTQISGEQASRKYVSEFNKIAQLLYGQPDPRDWITIHSRLSQWENEFDDLPDIGLRQPLADQRKECDVEFGKYFQEHYLDWIHSQEGAGPPLSTDVVKNWVVPHLQDDKKVVFIVIDCMRLDQWLTIEEMLYQDFRMKKDYYYSIVPTATPYSRNAIFSGYSPSRIQEEYGDIWEQSEDDDTSMNRFEHEFLLHQLQRDDIDFSKGSKYIKVVDSEQGRSVENNFRTLMQTPLITLVINFVDILAHQRSQSEFLQEIVPDEAGYRTTIRAWFEHSWLLQVLKQLRNSEYRVVITTDHGSIRVQKPAIVKADREASSNIRYKYGRNLNTDPKQAMLIKEPEKYLLPARGINTTYLLAKEQYYFVYPT